jgi:hypothetical protein
MMSHQIHEILLNLYLNIELNHLERPAKKVQGKSISKSIKEPKGPGTYLPISEILQNS